MDWQYEPSENLDQTLSQRLRNFPREPEILVYVLRSLAAIGMRLWLKVFHRLTITGTQLPKASCILVANHSSHYDAPCLQAAVPLNRLHRVFPAAAQDYFFRSLHLTCFAAIFVNALPFSRSTNIRQSLDLCRNLLQNEGNILILFPEGTRSTDGKLRSFRPGIGAIVAGTDIPVIPCWIEGASRAWPKGTWLPKPRRMCVRFGKAMTFAEYGQDKSDFLQIAQRLNTSVEELSHAED